MDYKNIKTTPEMNKSIKELLALSKDPSILYTLKRIEELEEQVKRLIDVLIDNNRANFR